MFRRTCAPLSRLRKKWILKRAQLLIVSLALPSFAAAANLDAGSAHALFAERQLICDRDKGALWGQDLCGPLLFVDPNTRSVVANTPDRGGLLKSDGTVSVGRLPDDIVISNTAITWGGQRWSMVSWPLPDAIADRESLMMHESWHRIQSSLGLPAGTAIASHLANPQDRVAMRMEWHALAAALRAEDEMIRARSVRDALIFRAWRRAQSADAQTSENQLELNEGLAEYTGQRLSGRTDQEIANQLDRAQRGESFVRSFAYASGPAYGFLLDKYQHGWRKSLTPGSDLGQMLGQAASVTLPGSSERAALESGRHYGLATVQNEERKREAQRQRQVSFWEARLTGPRTLRIAFEDMHIQFDPRNLFPLPPHGTVYPTLTVVDRWGTLTVRKGALIDDGWTSVTVTAPQGAVAQGPGWSLSLKPGWAVRQSSPLGGYTIAKQ